MKRMRRGWEKGSEGVTKRREEKWDEKNRGCNRVEGGENREKGRRGGRNTIGAEGQGRRRKKCGGTGRRMP